MTLAPRTITCVCRVALLGGVSSLAACAAAEEAAPIQAAAAAPNVVALGATEYAIDAPDTLPAGWTTLHMANHDTEIHYGHIVGLDSGRTVKDLVDAYAAAIRTSGPRPKWVKRFGGPGGTSPGDSSSVTQFLEPGSYVWICPVEDDAENPHFGKGEFKPFVVHAADAAVAGRGAAPQADVVVRLMDSSFSLDTPLTAGAHTLRVENAGVEPHDLVMMTLAPGRTLEEVLTALNPERARRPDQRREPPTPLESLGTFARGIAAIAPGIEVYLDATLPPGEYVMVCMASAPDARSHIEHGMARQLTVR